MDTLDASNGQKRKRKVEAREHTAEEKRKQRKYYWGERRVLSPSRWPAVYRKIIFDTTDSSEITTWSTKDNNWI